MSEIEYEPDRLRQAGRVAAEAARHAESVVNRLDTPPATGIAGRTPMSAAFHQALSEHHQAHVRFAGHLVNNYSTAGKRATKTAALGDELTAETTRIAPRTVGDTGAGSGGVGDTSGQAGSELSQIAARIAEAM